jgi:hypothetical protein
MDTLARLLFEVSNHSVREELLLWFNRHKNDPMITRPGTTSAAQDMVASLWAKYMVDAKLTPEQQNQVIEAALARFKKAIIEGAEILTKTREAKDAPKASQGESCATCPVEECPGKEKTGTPDPDKVLKDLFDRMFPDIKF